MTKRLKKKSKWLLSIVAAVYIGALIAIPLYADRSNVRSGLPECPPHNNNMVLFPNPNDCRRFYECVMGIPVSGCCPDGLWFCEEFKFCAFPNNVNCSFDCIAIDD